MRMNLLLATVFGDLMVGVQPAIADPLPSIDWKQLEESVGETGDHVVGEELCVRQTAPPEAMA